MSEFIGKTIASIDEEPRDPKYGGEDRGTLLIHFTDGSALHVAGHSYEDVDLSLNALSPEDVRRRQAGVQGQRENARMERLQREEWLSLSCEQRAERKAEAKSSGHALIMRDLFDGLQEDMIRSYQRMVFSDKPMTLRKRCPRCGERMCPNAPTEEIPASPNPLWGGFTAVIPSSTE